MKNLGHLVIFALCIQGYLQTGAIQDDQSLIHSLTTGTKAYYLWKVNATRTQALELCNIAGMSLAGIKDASQTNAVHHLISQHGDLAGKYWISATKQPDDQWIWADGQPFSYTNWNDDEPNNAGPENCLELVPDSKWNDVPCYVERYFICEKIIIEQSNKSDSCNCRPVVNVYYTGDQPRPII